MHCDSRNRWRWWPSFKSNVGGVCSLMRRFQVKYTSLCIFNRVMNTCGKPHIFAYTPNYPVDGAMTLKSLFERLPMRSTKASAAVERLKARSENAPYSMVLRSDGMFSLVLVTGAG